MTRRAFTLLETVLAAVLGLLVIMSCMALFGAMERSDRRQIDRLDRTTQLSLAHRTISRAMQLIVLSDGQPPSDKEKKAKEERDAVSVEGDNASLPDPEAAGRRFALQPDPYIDEPIELPSGRTYPPQRFRLALRATPVAGGRPTDADAGVDLSSIALVRSELLHESGRRSRSLSDRRRERDTGSDGSSARSGGRSGRDGDPPLDLASAGRRRGDRDADEGDGERTDEEDLSAEERRLDDLAERPRAPGVIGYFELLPDGAQAETGVVLTDDDAFEDRRRDALARGTGERFERGWSLWWREVPTRAQTDELLGLEPEDEASETDDAAEPPPEADEPDAASDRESRREREEREAEEALRAGVENADGSGKRVLLISGLRWCHWTAFRKRRQDPKMWTDFTEGLPAYIELAFETVEGRQENWMFEVGWTVGPEPGALLTDTANGPLGPGADQNLNPGENPQEGQDGDGKGTEGVGRNGMGGQPNKTGPQRGNKGGTPNPTPGIGGIPGIPNNGPTSSSGPPPKK